MTERRDHEWITVGLRRWCLGCHAFQVQKNGWKGIAGAYCPRSTPYALNHDGTGTIKRTVPNSDAT